MNIAVQLSTTMHSTFFGSVGPRSPEVEMSQDLPQVQVEADERVAQLERQLAQKELAFAALEQESLLNDFIRFC